MNIYDHFSSKDVVSSEIDISCIGAFDGLHLGHLELIKSTFNYSKNFQIITIVKRTFDKFQMTKM
jgi:FAD synthase